MCVIVLRRVAAGSGLAAAPAAAGLAASATSAPNANAAVRRWSISLWLRAGRLGAFPGPEIPDPLDDELRDGRERTGISIHGVDFVHPVECTVVSGRKVPPFLVPPRAKSERGRDSLDMYRKRAAATECNALRR